MNQKQLNVLLIGGLMLLMIFAFTLDDIDEAAEDDKAYCGMVKDYKESHGQRGWPAFKGEEVCRGL